ncbi:MAG: hypothetical protein WD066_09120 [Planctomycetaceae bacterium]
MDSSPGERADSRLEQPVYILESQSGLVVTQSPEFGRHLPYWTSRERAEAMRDYYKGPLSHDVSEMSVPEFFGQLLTLQESGMKYVILDKSPTGSATVVPITDALEYYGRSLLSVAAPGASAKDFFVKMLDEKRSLGIPTTKEDEYLPIDCPECGEMMAVHEVAYRRWRDGQMSEMLCPKCLSLFSQAPFASLRCHRCREYSGRMPLSLWEQFHQSEPSWTCDTCKSRVATQDLLTRIPSIHGNNRRAEGSIGCLLVVLIAITTLSVVPSMFSRILAAP